MRVDTSKLTTSRVDVFVDGDTRTNTTWEPREISLLFSPKRKFEVERRPLRQADSQMELFQLLSL